MIIPSRRGALPIAICAAAIAAGAIAAWHYARLGLTLSHYDARGHLIVARRVLDSITPGWQQIGAVWLPLPHLLNLLPVQIDGSIAPARRAWRSRCSRSPSAPSTIAWIVLRLTDSIGRVGVSPRRRSR